MGTTRYDQRHDEGLDRGAGRGRRAALDGSSRITLKATAEQTNGGYGLIVS